MSMLKGKHVVVSAAAQGIGRAIAERFAAEGARVWATDIQGPGLDTLRAGGIQTQILDSCDAAAVAAYFRTFERIDVLVNCVGYVAHGTVLECSIEEWQRSLRINLDTVFLATQMAIPLMVKARAGSIVNIASVVSSIKGFPSRAAYGAAKAGVIGLTKSVAADYVGSRIRCNAICPGTIDSPSLRQRIEALGQQLGSLEKAEQAFVDRQPLGRLGTPAEIAALCLYLASDASSFVTGQTFVIDGGIDI